jgi:hypothetical protein
MYTYVHEFMHVYIYEFIHVKYTYTYIHTCWVTGCIVAHLFICIWLNWCRTKSNLKCKLASMFVSIFRLPWISVSNRVSIWRCWVHNQGDQIGCFSPNVRLLSLGSFLKITEAPTQIFWPRKKLILIILTQLGWDTFWAIFTQTHLVTLSATSAICSPSPRGAVVSVHKRTLQTDSKKITFEVRTQSNFPQLSTDRKKLAWKNVYFWGETTCL